MSPPLICFDRAVVRKGTRNILDQVSFSVARGQHTVILGPNGCGKSTLLKLLTLQEYPAWTGQVEPQLTIMGEERWNVFELRKQLGIVSGDFTNRFLTDASSARLSGLDVVLTGYFAGRDLYDWTPINDQMRSEAHSALQRLGVERLAHQSLETMSTGEQRRVIIARALVHRPHTLVLDEPTSGLDPVATVELIQRLDQLAVEGTTLVVVTHHTAEIPRAVCQVVLLNRGKVQRIGPPDDVCTTAEFSRLYDRPLYVTGRVVEGTLRIECVN